MNEATSSAIGMVAEGIVRGMYLLKRQQRAGAESDFLDPAYPGEVSRRDSGERLGVFANLFVTSCTEPRGTRPRAAARRCESGGDSDRSSHAFLRGERPGLAATTLSCTRTDPRVVPQRTT